MKKLVYLLSSMLTFSFSCTAFSVSTDAGYHGMGYDYEACICAMDYAEYTFDRTGEEFLVTHQDYENDCSDNYSGEIRISNLAVSDAMIIASMAPADEVYVISKVGGHDVKNPCEDTVFLVSNWDMCR